MCTSEGKEAVCVPASKKRGNIQCDIGFRPARAEFTDSKAAVEYRQQSRMIDSVICRIKVKVD